MAALIEARNHSELFYKAVQLVLDVGKLVNPRGLEALEVENVLFQVEHPAHMHLFVPLRANNPISTMAEALWVLAGRDDMEFLTYYLPRAIEFSDDQKAWRGAYGPRLRNWNGIDQLREIDRILKADRHSRQAVMMIFDPDKDFVVSKDIPCNNQLAVTIRENKLNLKVCSRSMDIVWGANTNIITWSVLQELLAGTLNAEMGTLAYFVSSFHLYASFVTRARSLLPAEGSNNPYSDPSMKVLMFDKFASVDDFDGWLKTIMKLENQIRDGEMSVLPTDLDPLSRQILSAFLIQRCLKEADTGRARHVALEMEDTDFSRAVTHYLEQERL